MDPSSGKTEAAEGTDLGAGPGGAPAPIRVQLRYAFETAGQSGASLANPLFELLAAVAEGGSIKAAALRLGASYRHVWGLLRDWEATLAEPLVSWSKGQPARLTAFAQRLLWEERRARTRMQPHIEALRADLERIVDAARGSDHPRLPVRASHDLALPVLQQHLAGTSGVHLEISFQGSVDSLKALAERQCLIAGFHVPPLLAPAPVFSRALRPWLRPRTQRLITCARRVQGLMMRHELAGVVQTLRDVARFRLRFSQRQPGSGTRLLIDHLLREQAVAPERLVGEAEHVEHTHVGVALSVASGVADVGLGIEAAARQMGLHFVPVVEEDYFLLCMASHLHTAGVEKLREALAGREWRRILTGLPGYAPPEEPGSLQRIEDVFPWWPGERMPSRVIGARRRGTASLIV